MASIFCIKVSDEIKASGGKEIAVGVNACREEEVKAIYNSTWYF